MTTPAGGSHPPGAPEALLEDGCRGVSGSASPHGRAGAEREPEGGTVWTADYHTGSPSRSNPDVPKQEPTPEMGCMGAKDPAGVFGYAARRRSGTSRPAARPAAAAAAT